jgi:hypothetical protein
MGAEAAGYADGVLRALEQAISACPPPVGRKTVVCVPDGTRPVDVGATLRALRPWLTGDVRVVVGLGLHRRMRAEELFESPFPVLQHDPDDTVPTRDVDGIPGGVFRAVAEADTVLGVGIVELHQYAGFSGGHKAVAVGCGARATLDALHHRDRVVAAGVALGRLAGNPFRAVVDALGEAARCSWARVTTGCGRTPAHLRAGDAAQWVADEPRRALAAAAESLDCWQSVPVRYDAAVLRVPARKAVNFYQASRAATYLGLSEAPPLWPGATLFLEARCDEGLGEGDGERAFARVLGAHGAPWSSLLDGPAPTGAGTQRAVMLALLLRRYRLVLCGVRDPEPFLALGVQATRASASEVAPSDALRVDDPFGRLPRYAPPA